MRMRRTMRSLLGTDEDEEDDEESLGKDERRRRGPVAAAGLSKFPKKNIARGR